MESIYRQFYDEPRFRPSVIGAQRAAAGLFGRKTGEGFYPYPQGDAASRPGAVPGAKPGGSAGDAATAATAAAATEGGVPVPVHVVAEPYAESLAPLVERLGARRVDDPSDCADGFVLVAPLGEDASRYAARRGLPAARVVAIDTLFDPAAPGCARRSLMPTVATDPQAVRTAAAFFGADGVAVSVLRDSCGFVAQRIVAMIVAIGCEIAQQRIAAPGDIDRAVRAGLSYPAGPLAMGDELGPARVLQVLEGMYAATGDPRYRPSLWLRRRAELGLSLQVQD